MFTAKKLPAGEGCFAGVGRLVAACFVFGCVMLIFSAVHLGQPFSVEALARLPRAQQAALGCSGRNLFG